ncbi:MAG: hypothetical protein DMD30_10265 [Gemmatimonadetes bacterium]|nr:MAG: hypothetical protein DMD30_10265 [Gemmatimonadota bacterium]
MHGLKGERVLMRIHIGERDKFEGEPLYWAIVQLLRKRHYAGATVTRGIMAFGASSRIHAAKFLELSLDLPIVIECVETQEKVDAILPELDTMVSGGLITLERVNVIMYRPHETNEGRPDMTTSASYGESPR